MHLLGFMGMPRRDRGIAPAMACPTVPLSQHQYLTHLTNIALVNLEAAAVTDADACDDDTQLGTDDSGSPRSPVSRIRTIMTTVSMSMAK